MKHCSFLFRIPSLFLLIALFLPILAGCGSDPLSAPDDTADPVLSENVLNAEEYPLLGGIPTLYIDLAGSYPLGNLTKEEYVGGTATLVGTDAADNLISVSVEMKGRGNYSWYDMEKKQYAIKFEEKQRVLGMGSARRWVLISNYSDKSFLRNYMTLNLAKDMGMPYTTASRYVNLVVNGEYNGLYLLTEKIEVHADRVDIDTANGDVLMEIDLPGRHNNECDYCIDIEATLPVPMHIRICEPEVDDYGEDVMTAAHELAKKLTTGMIPGLNRGLDTLSEIIDVESFVDWYILNEFVRNGDSAFWTSCYCYIEDGILHMGPVWDYDTCMGNQANSAYFAPEGFYIGEQQRAYWYYRLTRNKDFNALVKERWTELRDAGVFDDFIGMIDETTAYIAESIKLDNERWPGGPLRDDLRGNKSCYSAEEEKEYIRSWVNTRIKWLDKQWYIGDK